MDPSPRHGDIEPPQRHPQILYSQHPDIDIPHGINTLPDLFSLRAGQDPDHPFLTFDNPDTGLTEIVTYGDTLDRITSLSKVLRRYRDRSPSTSSSSQLTTSPRPIGIWFDKSIDLHLAILATTFTGSAWLPFDPDVPFERVGVCLKDSNASILLCDELHEERARKAVASIMNVVEVMTYTQLEKLSRFSEAIENRQAISDETDETEDRGSWPHASDTAYMIYTSGSTGTPKGIEISHGSAVTFAMSERSVLGTTKDDVVWQGFSPAFDMFIEEVWVSIAGGASLIVGNRTQCQDVASLGGSDGVWARHGVTIVNAVPTLVNIMTSLGTGDLPSSIRLLNLGGEACPKALVERLWKPSLTIINTYGPTETTVTATYDILHPDRAVTIGTPLPSYHTLLLDIDENATTRIKPLDISEGVEGQLAIGGPCVGKGYLNRPELTASKFIPHPILPDQRLYLTGDRVRLDQDHKLVFLGRIDTQVKHRGFRIELGEIESLLSTHPNVQVATVICARAGTDNAQLEAYIVPKIHMNSVDFTKTLQTTLKGLPAYMRPEKYVFVAHEELPRLPSGKVNLNALHAISNDRQAEEERLERRRAEEATMVPLDLDPYAPNKSESTVLGVIMRALAVTFPQAASSGILTPAADFFCDLGGHSLTAAMLVSRIRKDPNATFGLKTIGLSDIYAHRTPSAIAKRFEEDQTIEISDKLESVDSNTDGDIEKENTSDYLLITNTRWILCGLAQLPPLLFFALLNIITLLGPYIVFDEVYLHYGIGHALLAAYGSFVLVPVALTLIGIVGKWIVLGKAKEGEYPLYGLYYYRWWLAGVFVELIQESMVGDSPLYASLLRLLGAKVGSYCHLSVMSNGPAMDLINIGNDCVIGKDVVLSVSTVERGRLCLRAIRIEDEVHIGSHCVIDGAAILKSGSKVGSLSTISGETVVGVQEHWVGSPARKIGSAPNAYGGERTRPSVFRQLSFGFACMLFTTFIIPILYLIPQIPGLLMFAVLALHRHHFDRWKQMAMVGVPASISYIVCVFVELVVGRYLLLGKLKPGTYKATSLLVFRKWCLDRLMDMSLLVLHPVYATLYVVPYLRALGVKIGKGAEVSNIRGIAFNLTDIGDQSFLADNVLVGEPITRGNTITYDYTTIGTRAFAGNSALLPQGAHLEDNTLVGVLSIAPDLTYTTPLKCGESCFGSPAIKMPARPNAGLNHAAHLLFSPRKSQIAMRLFIEGTRIWLPRLIIIYGLAFGLEVFKQVYHDIGIGYTILVLPIFDLCLFSFPAVIITVTLKWILVGEYRPSEWPLWSRQVWLSEFTTSMYESLLAPLLLARLVGTPYLAMILRLLGTEIGSKCTLLSHDMTEWDMVALGDEAVLNLHAGPQTHLFEDRVMRVNQVNLGRRSVMKTYAICLPDSAVGEGSTVGSLSAVMRGESVPAFEEWQGAPLSKCRNRRKA